MDNDNFIGCVHLELSKVFDIVDHSLFSEKLRMYGTELEWFTDCLFNGPQLVELNHTHSTVNNVTTEDLGP